MARSESEPRLAAPLLDRIGEVEEVDIETVRASGEARLTRVWIVADDARVHVRSVRGAEGWWYRDLRARPAGAIHLDGQRIPVRAVPAEDGPTIETVSELLRAKYGRRQPASTRAMLMPHTLATTLTLVPI